MGPFYHDEVTSLSFFFLPVFFGCFTLAGEGFLVDGFLSFVYSSASRAFIVSKSRGF